jgi:hypothetical protein
MVLADDDYIVAVPWAPVADADQMNADEIIQDTGRGDDRGDQRRYRVHRRLIG